MAFSELELKRIEQTVGGFCRKRSPVQIKDKFRLRACLLSIQADDEEREDDHVEASGELAFAVVPEAAAVVEPGKRAFDHPAFGDDLEGVELVAFGDGDRRTEDGLHGGGERLSCIPAIDQHLLHVRERGLVDCESFKGSHSVGYIGRGDQQHMREPLRIHANVAFDPRHQLAAVKALLFRRVGVFDALRVHDEEAGFCGPTTVLPDRANHIFLRPFRGGCHALSWACVSTGGNTNNTPAMPENQQAACATDNHS